MRIVLTVIFMLSQLSFLGLCATSTDVCQFRIASECKVQCTWDGTSAQRDCDSEPCGFLDSSCPYVEAVKCEAWTEDTWAGEPTVSAQDSHARRMYASLLVSVTFFLGTVSGIAAIINGAPDKDEDESDSNSG